MTAASLPTVYTGAALTKGKARLHPLRGDMQELSAAFASTYVGRVRKLRDQGILTDEEMHHQSHLLVTGREGETSSPPSAEPAPVEVSVSDFSVSGASHLN